MKRKVATVARVHVYVDPSHKDHCLWIGENWRLTLDETFDLVDVLHQFEDGSLYDKVEELQPRAIGEFPSGTRFNYSKRPDFIYQEDNAGRFILCDNNTLVDRDTGQVAEMWLEQIIAGVWVEKEAI